MINKDKPDWQLEAEKELRDYGRWRNAETIQNLKDQIEMLNIELYSASITNNSLTPVKSGGNKYNDNRDNRIEVRDKKNAKLKEIELRTQIVQRGLKPLTDDERTALEVFYIDPPYGESFIQILMEKIHLEKSRSYQVLNNAIFKFAININGCIET